MIARKGKVVLPLWIQIRRREGVLEDLGKVEEVQRRLMEAMFLQSVDDVKNLMIGS
jgi:hypothetical protein